MNWTGIISGIAMIILTGIFHPVVVKCEYYFGARAWPAFLVMGIASLGVSAYTESAALSSIAGILGAVVLWCIRELKEQEKKTEGNVFRRPPETRSA